MDKLSARRLIAGAVSAALVSTPVLAEKAKNLSNLVGIRASSGESELQSRGFSHVKTEENGSTKVSYWWHAGDKNCIKVDTWDGRYTAIVDASDSDCGHKSGSGAAVGAAAVIGAVAIGALLLSRKDKNRPNNDGYQQDWQQVQATDTQSGSVRVFANPDKNARVVYSVNEGAMLRNYGCENYNGESWCEVTRPNGTSRGWARDRYLRVVSGPGYNPPGSGGGWNGDMVEVYGLKSGTLNITESPNKNAYVVGRVNSGTMLRKSYCQQSGGESWCQVSTTNGYMHGWARERYLRSASAGQLPSYPGGGSGAWEPRVETGDLVGARAAGAMDELSRRGFSQVDNFASGNTRYSIQWRYSSRQCLQVTIADGRIYAINDIGQHPRCN